MLGINNLAQMIYRLSIPLNNFEITDEDDERDRRAREILILNLMWKCLVGLIK